MTNEKKILRVESAVATLLWIAMFTTPLLFAKDFNRSWKAINIMWIEFAIAAIIVSINRSLLMPKLFFKKKYTVYAISVIVILIGLFIFVFFFGGVNSILMYFTDSTLHHPAPSIEAIRPKGLSHLPRTVIPPSFNLIIITLIMLVIDIGMSMTSRWVISEQRQAEMQRENISAQLANLQNQISPHFFMNTLNNIHALVEINPPRAQETIIELSSLMDFLLYESSNTSKVPLQREMDFTNSYVNLMRLRYPERVKISFSYPNVVPNIKIPPLLFLNFIENAFKYGVDYTKKSYIDIEFNFHNEFIELTATNSNHSKSIKKNRRGLGISNSRKRLDLIFQNRYSLYINETEENYAINLKIPVS